MRFGLFVMLNEAGTSRGKTSASHSLAIHDGKTGYGMPDSSHCENVRLDARKTRYRSAKLKVRQYPQRQRFVHRQAFVGKWINLWAMQVKQKALFALANVERSS